MTTKAGRLYLQEGQLPEEESDKMFGAFLIIVSTLAAKIQQ
jgi:hypothetical protein